MLRIANGTVHDPAQGIDGVVQDLWIKNGRIVPPPADPSSFQGRTLDASGLVVMPGGIDMHCHIAGPVANAGRLLTPEATRSGAIFRREPGKRSGTVGLVPTTFATGHLFARLGYTTAMDAAIPPLHARHAHAELADTPFLDKGFFTLLGNNHGVLDRIAAGDEAGLDAQVAWALSAAKGYAIKVVNPGDVENWKQISRKALRELDEPVEGFGASPRQIVRALAGAADRLSLPHPVHLHCNNLGIPGNWETTLRTMEALEGHRGHFAHIQFHSYAGDKDDPRSFASAAPQLVEYVKNHTNITVDVGHVNPGPAIILTADAQACDRIRRLTGQRWLSFDVEQETSCGVIPIEYQPQKSLVHAIQWAISLEWYLLMDDPWRIALTSDHPNGGAFYHYPEIIHLLMDRNLRAEFLERMPKGVRNRTTLADLDREYSLSEIGIITRAAPARILGLKNKGHLGPGADADVTLYSPQADRAAMFARPRWVLKSGEIIAEDGQTRPEVFGRTFHVEPSFDPGHLPAIRERFERESSIQFRNYPVAAESLPHAEPVACRSS
ncbi:formylmethanofuran dehydrogenase subunit A [soil metagenome]